jgi:hypothetical protein
MAYDDAMRRVWAVMLVVLFSLSLIGPAISAANPESNLPACCRRDGKHHCAMMTMRSATSSGPVVAGARCAAFPSLSTVPVTNFVAVPPVVRTANFAPAQMPVFRPQTRCYTPESFSRTRQKRGPPTFPS